MGQVKELMVMRIGRHLPKRIKTPLWEIYFKYNIDRKLLKDLMEFCNTRYNFNLTYDEAIYMVKLGGRLVANLWNQLNPQTEEEIKKFYKINPYYVFEFISWHASIEQRNFRKKIVEYSFGDVLDYGGGIGDLSLKIAEKGLNVTYGDIGKRNIEFAEWVFKKRGFNIKVLDLDKDLDLLEEYDTIICIDVIEHVTDQEVVLNRLARHLRRNGRLIITKLNWVDDDPMHLKMEFDAEKLLNSLGVFKSEEYDWLWVKKS